MATEAMRSLQGAILPSSERGGMRIEYARSKMGEGVSTTLFSHTLRIAVTSGGIEHGTSSHAQLEVVICLS